MQVIGYGIAPEDWTGLLQGLREALPDLIRADLIDIRGMVCGPDKRPGGTLCPAQPWLDSLTPWQICHLVYNVDVEASRLYN